MLGAMRLHVETTADRVRTARVVVASCCSLYKLYLLGDGSSLTHIYSQSNAGEAFSLRLGAGSVIPGFDEAVLSMSVGCERVAVIPPSIGYVRACLVAVPASIE